MSMHKLKRLVEFSTEVPSNYMFFQNLKSIKNMVDSMLEYDEQTIDAILKEHDLESDHITTSKDDISEVFEFLNANASTRSSGYMDFKEPEE